jgi:hypothetical protein
MKEDLGNKIKKIFGRTRDEATERFRILQNEELRDFQRSALFLEPG